MVQVCGIELIPNYDIFGHIILRILFLESKSTNEDSNKYLKQE